MVKKTVIFCLIFVFLIIIAIQANADTGVGIIVGDLNGLSLKFNHFPIVGLAWNTGGFFHAHIDYWALHPKLGRSVYLYLGFGFNFQTKNDNLGLGLRIPVGLSFFLSRQFEIFAEIVPLMHVTPDTDFDQTWGVGARFHF